MHCSLLRLAVQDARNLHLAAQGLLHRSRRLAKQADILTTIRRMSLLQIDTINVVARSPYLVLFSRLGAYPQQWLDDALANGDLMEYWAHEACFLPRSDFALVRHRMLNPESMGWKFNAKWMTTHEADVNALLDYIEQHGPVRSADFTHPKSSSGWWEWKPHKRHLEGLFTAGKVMVVERRNFQRVYDLMSRAMPLWNDQQHSLSQAEAEKHMLLNSARSLGIFKPEWLADYYRLKKLALAPLLKEWQQQEQIIQVDVDGLGAMWVHCSLADELALAQQGKLNATHSAVLSPFDPVVWDRKRAEQLFNFSYRLECYTPAEKRRYGYFVLPLLHKGELVGRMDAKMHRAHKTLEVINVYLEDNVKAGAGLAQGLRSAVSDFALWQGAEQVDIKSIAKPLLPAFGNGWDLTSAPS